MRTHGHTEGKNIHWGLPEGGGWEKGKDKEKEGMDTRLNTWTINNLYNKPP